MAERVPTQFIETFKSSDFGPEQEEEGARVEKLARPPPTEIIETHQGTVRAEEEVLAEIQSEQGSLIQQGQRVASEVWTAAQKGAQLLVEEGRRVLNRTQEPASLVTVGHDCALMQLPQEGATEIIGLLRGTRVSVFPEIDAPPGWIAVRAPAGELGYALTHQLLDE